MTQEGYKECNNARGGGFVTFFTNFNAESAFYCKKKRHTRFNCPQKKSNKKTWNNAVNSATAFVTWKDGGIA